MPETRKRSRGNGEGSIYFSESTQKWVAQYTIGTSSDGKQRRKTFYGKTRKEVKQKLDSFIANGSPAENKYTTLKTLISAAIDYKHSINITSDNSYHRNLETLKKIEKHYIATIPIQRIKDGDLQNYLASITDCSNSAISKIYNQLNNAFKRAVTLELIRHNPLDDKQTFAKPKSTKATKKVSALTVDEQKRFLSVINKNTPYYMQMLLSMFAGMRMGEVNALKTSDIDNNIVHIRRTITKDINDKPIIGKRTKTYAGMRDVTLNSYLVDELKEYLKNKYTPNKQDLVFLARDKSLITTSQVNMQFKRICKKYSINKGDGVNQHMLRHTFATRCIESGMPAKVLQKLLGHTDIKTTLNTYCDVFEAYEKTHTDTAFAYLQTINIIP